jgi:SAM-dependent methyltransferase
MPSAVRAYYDQVGAAFDASYEWDGPLYPSNRIRADHAVALLTEHCPGGRVLDAGCGTGIILAELRARGFDAYGYDFSEEAIKTARIRCPGRATVGELEDPPHYREPFDAVLVVGAFTHPLDHVRALKHLYEQVKPGGLLIVELRNELFDLFTFNEYTVASLRHWLPPSELTDAALKGLATHTYRRPPIPPQTPVQQAHEAFFDVPAVWRNPLTVGEEYRAAGFEEIDRLAFHFHAVPPVFEALDPVAFRRESLALEKNPRDWRGLFMASAFLLVCRRV